MKFVIFSPLTNMLAWQSSLSLFKPEDIVYVVPYLESDNGIILTNETPELVQFELLGVQFEFLHPDPDLLYMTTAALEYSTAVRSEKANASFSDWYDPYETTDDEFFKHVIATHTYDKTNSVEYFDMQRGALLQRLAMYEDSTNCLTNKHVQKLSYEEHNENMYVRRGVKR